MRVYVFTYTHTRTTHAQTSKDQPNVSGFDINRQVQTHAQTHRQTNKQTQTRTNTPHTDTQTQTNIQKHTDTHQVKAIDGPNVRGVEFNSLYTHRH